MSEILMPCYQLFIKGQELDEFRYSMIQSITFEDNATGSDLLTIEIEDPEFVFINDDIFIEDVKVKFKGGYLGNMRTMFEGWIALVEMDFPDTGAPRLTIHCMDNTHVMNRVKKKRTWQNTTRAKVARQIFQEYGLKAVVEDSGKVEETISQSNETDISLLTKLVDEEIDPFLVYLEGGTGYYVKKKILASPQATLDYREGSQTIISFSPKLNKESKQVETRSSNVNLKDKKVDKGQANNNTSRDVQGKDTQSTDRTNGQSSWQYGGSGSWSKTY